MSNWQHNLLIWMMQNCFPTCTSELEKTLWSFFTTYLQRVTSTESICCFNDMSFIAIFEIVLSFSSNCLFSLSISSSLRKSKRMISFVQSLDIPEFRNETKRMDNKVFRMRISQCTYHEERVVVLSIQLRFWNIFFSKVPIQFPFDWIQNTKQNKTKISHEIVHSNNYKDVVKKISQNTLHKEKSML
jgi:hypothetical protein